MTAYVALYHSSSTKETMALHRAGCADIKRDAERHGSNLQDIEAEDVTAALDVMVDDELTEMGYTHNDVRVYPCTDKPKEAVMPTAAPNRANFPAGANGTRRYNQAVIQFKQALVRESQEEYDRLTAIPLSQRTAADNRRIRTLGNRRENTTAGRTGEKETTVPATATAKRQPASKPAPANGRKGSVAKGTVAGPGSARKAAAAKPGPKSTVKKETTAKATVRSRVPVPSGFKSWEDPKLATRVLKEKASGKTIKEITAGLGLPTDERHAHKVSLVYRKAADAKGTRTTKRSK
jgi:hypothetical protein